MNSPVFLYLRVLDIELGDFSDFTRATTPKKLPTVLTPSEISSVLGCLEGNAKLCAALMYGSGLRVMETVRLRVQNIDFERLSVLVRDGKCRKPRITTLAPELCAHLEAQIAHAETLFKKDCLDPDWGGVY